MAFATSQPVFHPLEATPKESKQRIPLLFFVIMGLLVGSASLQLLRQRDEFVAFTKETDEKLALLREVVKRIQNGENVDVEKVLGTGDPTREKEWEQGKENDTISEFAMRDQDN
ncbi:MAG: hypothetical protein M1831_005052 [Alyxoria varia]|nr:MAG: hypothetical protein M1831_005052 [Alyxoria varia]